jgi:hypothetical protein
MGYKSEMQVLEVKVRSGVIYLKRPSESKLAKGGPKREAGAQVCVENTSQGDSRHDCCHPDQS